MEQSYTFEVGESQQEISFVFDNLHDHHRSHVFWFCLEQSLQGKTLVEISNKKSKEIPLETSYECF